MTAHELTIADLRCAKPLYPRSEFDQLLAKVLTILDSQVAVAPFALVSGPEALVFLQLDRRAALAAATAIRNSADAARALRKLAAIIETGAVRADCALRARTDHRAIFEEAAK